MGNKYARMSWLLPLIGFILFNIVEAVSGNDYPVYGVVGLVLLIWLLLSLTGLISGIISLRKIHRKHFD